MPLNQRLVHFVDSFDTGRQQNENRRRQTWGIRRSYVVRLLGFLCHRNSTFAQLMRKTAKCAKEGMKLEASKAVILGKMHAAFVDMDPHMTICDVFNSSESS
ncbi:hypothetical protein R6Q59_023903 [Mikania micrantha]